MGGIKTVKSCVLGGCLLAVFLLLAGCGPNDRLRDNYMGKPTPKEYKPIKRDEMGNPVIKPDASQ